MFISNAFSLQMVDFPCTLECEEITPEKFEECKKTAESAIGHADTASVLGLPCNRVSIKLKKGDIIIVAQLQGGRLPEGATTLPEGFYFKYILITIK